MFKSVLAIATVLFFFFLELHSSGNDLIWNEMEYLTQPLGEFCFGLANVPPFVHTLMTSNGGHY